MNYTPFQPGALPRLPEGLKFIRERSSVLIDRAFLYNIKIGARTPTTQQPRRKQMTLLTPEQREEIIRRRGTKSDKTGTKSRIDYLEIHHKDRNPHNNDPTNLRIITKKEHGELHKRAGD